MTKPVYPGLQRIIDHLKQMDDSEDSILGFDMNLEYNNRNDSHHSCGSACCIGGHAEYILGPNPDWELHEFLRELCEIPDFIANELCWAEATDTYVDMSEITLAQALLTLENCRDTGEVNWQLSSK